MYDSSSGRELYYGAFIEELLPVMNSICQRVIKILIFHACANSSFPLVMLVAHYRIFVAQTKTKISIMPAIVLYLGYGLDIDVDH
jgi:hypothetical protein